MNGRIRRNFTLIELMAVMLLMGVLMVMMLPAFNRMIRGNKVDQATSNLKLGLEQAQARAVSSRRPVALVLPTKQSDWTTDADTRVVYPFCYGGYRLAYVEADGADWKFVRWVPDSEWKGAPDGAMLVRVLVSSDADYDTIKEGDGIGSALSDPTDATGGKFSSLMTVKQVKVGGNTVNVGGLVFSPYGGLKSDKDMRLAVAEAVPSGSSVVYPTKDSSGKPVNWLMLSINKFTGRVSYYPAED